MRTPYPAPPLALRKALGSEVYDYFERMHGLVQGLGGRDDDVGSLDLRNLGIKDAKAGSLLAVGEDGEGARVVDPFVENLRSQSAGFLQADADGNIGASPVDIAGVVTNIVRQEFAAAEVEDGEITPGGGLTAGDMDYDYRRYSMLVS